MRSRPTCRGDPPARRGRRRLDRRHARIACVPRLAENVRIVAHDRSRGKGAAVRTALAQAEKEIAAILDADLEYRAADLADVITPLLEGRANVVFGTRAWTSRSSCSFWYVMGNKAVTFATNLLCNCWISDVMTGHKAMRTDLFPVASAAGKGIRDRARDRGTGAARAASGSTRFDRLRGEVTRAGKEADRRRWAARAPHARALQDPVVRTATRRGLRKDASSGSISKWSRPPSARRCRRRG